jgi:hypothetical protein
MKHFHRKFLFPLVFAVLIANSSANAQQRDVFDWPWGMSCAEIERQYGKGNSSDYDGRKEIVSYKIEILGQVLEARFYCNGRGMFWGDGEFASLTIGGDYYSIQKEKIHKYCESVSHFLKRKYGNIVTILDNRRSGGSVPSVSYFYESSQKGTKVHLYCQDRYDAEFMNITISRFNG